LDINIALLLANAPQKAVALTIATTQID